MVFPGVTPRMYLRWKERLDVMQAAHKLKLIVERLESLDEEKKALNEAIRDILAEARGDGFNVKILRKILQIRKMKPHEADEEDHLLHTYLAALRNADALPSPSDTNVAQEANG